MFFIFKLDRNISTFIWAGKTLRAKYSLLQRTKKDGGLVLPNFLAYYWTAMSKKSTCGTTPLKQTGVRCSCVSPAGSICAPLNSYPLDYTSNPIVWPTVQIWRQFRRLFKVVSASTLMPICDNHLFPASVSLCGRRRAWFLSNNSLLIKFSFLLILLKLHLIFHNLIYLDIFRLVTLLTIISPLSPWTSWFPHR